MHCNTKRYYLIFISLFLLISIVSGNSVKSLNATVAINCLFTVNLNGQSVYLLSNSIPFNYTINSSKNNDCNISEISGALYFWKVNQTQSEGFKSLNITLFNVTNQSKLHNIYSNTSKLISGKYYANLSFVKNYFKEITNGPLTFQVVTPPEINVKLVNFTNSVTQYSPVTLQFLINNNGTLSTNNNTYMNVKIIGPQNFSMIKNYSLGSIRSNSNLTKVLSFYSISNTTGVYTITENTSYSYNYTYKNKTSSFTKNTTNYIVNYTVSTISPVSNSGSSSSNPVTKKITSRPTPPSVVSNVSYVTTPALITLINNQSSLYSVNLYNNFSNSVWVNISTTNVSGVSLSLSSKNVYLLPHQSLSVGLTLSTSNTKKQNSKILPLNEHITNTNHTSVNYTQFIFLQLLPKNNNMVYLKNVLSLNDSRDIEGTIAVTNTKNYTINGTVTALIPSIITNNAKNIVLSGGQGTISKSNTSYKLDWNVSTLASNDSTYLYYYIKNVSNLLLAQTPTITFSIPQKTSKTPSLSLYNTQIPTLYTNQSGIINFTFLYTGTTANNITATLSSSSGLNIGNAQQSFKVIPNTVFSPSYNIGSTSKSGTYYLTLYLTGSDLLKNYTFEAVVLPELETPELLNINNTTPSTIVNNKYLEYYGYDMILALITISILIIIYKNKNKTSYNERRVKKLKEINEQIRRGQDWWNLI